MAGNRSGSGGIVTHGVTCTQTCGCMKVDDGKAWVQMLGPMSSMGQVTDTGGGLLGCGKCVEMGESRCV